jgi:ABC-2 type transport system permease protein
VIARAIAKDVELLVRDRGALISLFALPIVFMVVFGAIFAHNDKGDVERWRVAVWSEPADPRGAAVARGLGEVTGFALIREAEAAAVRRAVAEQRVSAGVVVSPDPAAPIELVIDLSAPIQTRAPLQYALEAIVIRALSPPIPPSARVDVRSPPGTVRTQASSFQVTVPANAVLFGFFIALTVAMSFATERRSGTWRRLLASPMSRHTILLASLVPYLIVGVCQFAILFGLGIVGFGMQVAGSPIALAVLAVATVTCAVSLGLLFAAFGGSERQLAGIGSVTLLVMGMVGGCMVPRLALPDVMQTIGLGVPHGWALDGYHAVLVQPGTTLADVALPIAVLFGFAAGFAGLGVALFRFER